MAKPKEKQKVIKKLSNGSKLYANFMVLGPVGRLGFVNFATPKTNENDDGTTRETYGCAQLFKKGENLTLMREACDGFAKREKGDKAKRFSRRPLRQQDDKVDDFDGFVEGGWYLNTSTKFPPTLTGPQREEIEASAFYSGCYSQILFRPYFYDNKGNCGISLGIAACQFVRDGKRLSGGGVDPNDYFDDHEPDDIGEDDEDDIGDF
jgi:hypothetical protein